MTKRMLIDATDPAEVRVVVLNRSRVEEFDHEIRSKAQLKGNIYLAKVTRVEPSLQAAFVDYGGNRHGFLPFSEIHPDYYRIPIADREALLAEEAALRPVADDEEDEGDGEAEAEAAGADVEGDDGDGDEPLEVSADDSIEEVGGEHHTADAGAAPLDEQGHDDGAADGTDGDDTAGDDGEQGGRSVPHSAEGGDQLSATPEEAETAAPAPIPAASDEQDQPGDGTGQTADGDEAPPYESAGDEASDGEGHSDRAQITESGGSDTPTAGDEAEESLDTVGGDDVEDAARRRAKLLRRYKIQEVIKRGQVMLVQVAKEERGNKGAALTTYLSLPGRYCVLMPNTARGGGISRKIGSTADRRRLKTVLGDLSIPDGMAVIVRTAGSERSKAEIKRDYEYLLRLWSEIRDITLNSQAPALIYEEGNLIKRAIRDLYSSDTEDILVEGEDAYKAAKAFMKSLMPSHAKKVQLYKDPAASIFLKHGVEAQLGGMFDSTVQLKSGGYIVINVTEALIAVDVNSGKATRERHIEETALKTNLEAADEVARQLRLRDLAGLIVIDFIDMEEPRHNRDVERRLKDAMKSDRARIQLGRISPFGLLELSRQRLRPSLVETAMVVCAHCAGTGRVYSAETASLHLLRSLSEEGMRRPGGELQVVVGTKVALYLLNHKREQLHDIEQRYGFVLRLDADDRLHGLEHRIDRPGVAREGRERDRERGRDRDRGHDRRGRGREEERGETREPERRAPEERAAPEERRSDERRSEERRGDERRGDERRGEERRGEERGERRGGRDGERRGREDGRRGRDRGPRHEPRGERVSAPAPAEGVVEETLEATEAELPPTELLEESQTVDATGAPLPDAEGDDDRPRRRRRRGKRGGRRRGRRREGEGQETNGPGDEASAQAGDDAGGEDVGGDDADGDDAGGDEGFDDQGGDDQAGDDQGGDDRGYNDQGADDRGEAEQQGDSEAGEAFVEPVRAEPARAEPVRAEPPARSEPSRPAAVARQETRHEEQAAEAEPAAAPSFDVITDVDPDQPKRKGWWNRLVK